MWCGAVGHPVGAEPGMMGTNSWGVRHPVGAFGMATHFRGVGHPGVGRDCAEHEM